MALKLRVAGNSTLMRFIRNPWGRAFLIACLTLGITGGAVFTHYYLKYAKLIEEKLEAGPFANMSTLYAASRAVLVGQQTETTEIAAYLRRARAVRCDPSQVVVVNGSQQGLDLCARVLIDPGDVAAIEDPCYPGARQLFAAHGARLHPVPVERDGIAVPKLPDRARLVFVTPSLQLPTGVSMSLGKRLALLAWARERGAVVIEDDYDSEYRYGGEPVPALQGLSDTASVVCVAVCSRPSRFRR